MKTNYDIKYSSEFTKPQVHMGYVIGTSIRHQNSQASVCISVRIG